MSADSWSAKNTRAKVAILALIPEGKTLAGAKHLSMLRQQSLV